MWEQCHTALAWKTVKYGTADGSALATIEREAAQGARLPYAR